MATLLDTYLPEISYNNGNCGYACSDHASWNAEGFPTVYPFEADFNGSNPAIHTGGDTLSVSQNGAAHALKFAKLAAAFVGEVAKGKVDETTEPGGEPEPTPPGNDDETEPGTCW